MNPDTYTDESDVKIRITGKPYDLRGLTRKTYRTVDASWSMDGGETWYSIPQNSKQAIEIARKIDAGEIVPAEVDPFAAAPGPKPGIRLPVDRDTLIAEFLEK